MTNLVTQLEQLRIQLAQTQAQGRAAPRVNLMHFSNSPNELTFDQALNTVRKAVMDSTPLSSETLSSIGDMITRISQSLINPPPQQSRPLELT